MKLCPPFESSEKTIFSRCTTGLYRLPSLGCAASTTSTTRLTPEPPPSLESFSHLEAQLPDGASTSLPAVSELFFSTHVSPVVGTEGNVTATSEITYDLKSIACSTLHVQSLVNFNYRYYLLVYNSGFFYFAETFHIARKSFLMGE